MKAPLFTALLCALFMFVSSVFGQRSKLAELVKQINVEDDSVYGKPVLMERFTVPAQTQTEVDQRTITQLERLFSRPRKDVGVISVEHDFERSSWKRGLEESALFEIGMRGRELKALKGGFELYGMDFYLKSGIAWHPEDDQYTTFTLGKKSSWKYSFWDHRDLGQKVLVEPVVKFNHRLEKIGERFIRLVRRN